LVGGICGPPGFPSPSFVFTVREREISPPSLFFPRIVESAQGGPYRPVVQRLFFPSLPLSQARRMRFPLPFLGHVLQKMPISSALRCSRPARPERRGLPFPFFSFFDGGMHIDIVSFFSFFLPCGFTDSQGAQSRSELNKPLFFLPEDFLFPPREARRSKPTGVAVIKIFFPPFSP